MKKDHDGCYMLNGFAYICHEFKPDDTIDVMLDMSVKHVYSNEKVADNDNKAAIQRGHYLFTVLKVLIMIMKCSALH